MSDQGQAGITMTAEALVKSYNAMLFLITENYELRAQLDQIAAVLDGMSVKRAQTDTPCGDNECCGGDCAEVEEPGGEQV